MNVLEYYHLNEDPYRIGPDPRFLYFSEQVKEALAKCQYMIRERIGPIYMYGPIGSGKTSILRRVNEYLSHDKRYNIAYMISPNVKTSNSFLRLVLEAFDVKTERSYINSLHSLERFLLEQHQAKRIPVLLVDEAQNLSRDTLKLVHYLLNFETATLKLLQVILVGQEELSSRILRFKELASRMYPIAMNAMSINEIRDMIAFRWVVAGGKPEQLPFDSETDDIYKTLFAYSKGLPRDIIKVCGVALQDVMVKGKQKATVLEVEAIAKELNLQK